LIDKIERLRATFKEEKTKFRKLEDEHEIILNSRLMTDKEIQKVNKILEAKNPKYNTALY